ncbi:hypothetical protein C8F04DRAFT_1262702 [Mycena alexandri]|uniref:HIT-type domain-containing protein n=1 Tax=Mycena alexandri TaxID=1745969 RepID=A0AAD6SQL9_9AGAR|nr:hypothetical protein C8F04DRAFT_1262702 [Mycena alexandri]
MSGDQPSASRIFAALKPAELGRASDTVTCGLCRRQFSKYTCPTCNVPYCSLTCFRSEAHSQCSETFYKKEVESDIRAEPSKTTQERQRMLELLKRFEEDSAAQGELGLEGEAEDDEDDLARRLQSVDLESTSSENLWAILTPVEREKFLKVMEDPSSDLALQLLASEDLEVEKQDPWWSAPAIPTEDLPRPSAKRYGVPPDPIEIPSSLVSPNLVGPSLIYNICALFIAYAYITRHLSLSPLSAASESDSEAAQSLFSQLTPFITSRTSKTLHPNLDSAITDLHSRLPADSATPQLFALLLRDTAALLRPSLVVEEDNMDAGPHARALRALGDLGALFRARVHVAHKITFYAASLANPRSGNAKDASLELEREAEMREVDLKAEKVEWDRLTDGSPKGRKIEILEEEDNRV